MYKQFHELAPSPLRSLTDYFRTSRFDEVPTTIPVIRNFVINFNRKSIIYKNRIIRSSIFKSQFITDFFLKMKKDNITTKIYVCIVIILAALNIHSSTGFQYFSSKLCRNVDLFTLSTVSLFCLALLLCDQTS